MVAKSNFVGEKRSAVQSRHSQKRLCEAIRCYAAIFAHNLALSPWILKYSNSCKHDYPISEFMAELLQIYTKRHAEMVEKFKVLW